MHNFYMRKCLMANQAQIMNISGNKIIHGETLALAIFNEELVANLKLKIPFIFNHQLYVNLNTHPIT